MKDMILFGISVIVVTALIYVLRFHHKAVARFLKRTFYVMVIRFEIRHVTKELAKVEAEIDEHVTNNTRVPYTLIARYHKLKTELQMLRRKLWQARYPD